ncbi:MAG: putative baseplate assembly protein [Coleofasciculaceae cyanobacterium]
MTSLPPKIDQRTYEEIVAQTENLAQQFTEWKPATPGKTDAGGALIRIFARMVKSVSDRLNQVPEKNFLAFLDLIGGQLNPPQPAKVPLTFYLAEGSPVDGLVPAHTQVSAPPAEGSEEEIVFETDRELVVTTAQLQGVFVREPSQDRYSDRTLEATGQKDSAFFAFTGDRPIEHSLYISCPEIFNLPELAELKLIITTDNANSANQFKNLPINWSYWYDAREQEISTSSLRKDNQVTFTFNNLLIPTPYEIHNQTAQWLQAKLTNISAILPQISNIQGEISITQADLTPDTCLFNTIPLDISKDFYPFGEQPELNETFYIALHDSFIKPNTTITIDINLSHQPIEANNLKITWEVGNGQEWQEIAGNNNQVRWIENSSAIQFTESVNIQAKLKFPNQENMPSPSTVNGETHYWIRARITQGHYGKAASVRQYPVYDDLAVLTEEVAKGAREIKVDSLDLFNVGDKIRLLPNTGGFPEEHQISQITQANKKLTLNSGTLNNNLAVGTRIMRKLIITETIPPTYDPPLVQSLKLTYNFQITEDAIYVANNDFNYYEPEYFITQLKQKVARGDKLLNLEKVQGLTVGEFLTINSESYQIEVIKFETNQVTLTSGISQDYPKNTPVNRNFRPFTPTIDKEPTLYLGFDKSFSNKTVTLYAQVEPPLPDELSTDVTSETFLTEAANTGETTLKVDDITGWESGDNLEIPNPSNPKQYDIYTIININDKQITLNKPLSQGYSQNNPVIYPKQPKLVSEYSSPLGWQLLGIQDETQAFYQSGLIQFVAPIDFSKIETFGKELYWLRVRWQRGNFRIKPRLRRILTNTTWAVQATTLKEEILGSSNSDPNQVFVASNTPILLGQQLQVQEGQIPLDIEPDRVKVIRDDLGEIEQVWVHWQEVADFYGSDVSDRHYTLDLQTGEIRFGDGQAGMIPPRGRNNIRLSFYRTGGGKQGNITSQTISQLKTTVPYIDRVINLEAAAGGGEQESLDRLKQRAPKQLRHRDRAVTLDDIADLAYEASTDVARVKVVTADLLTTNFSPLNENFWLDPTRPDIPFEDSLNEKLRTINDSERANFEKMMRDINRRAGQVKVIILPHSYKRQPIPSLALLKRVETYIRARCQATMDLAVTAPQWQEVTVTATIAPVSFDNADILRNIVKQSLEAFLHPLTGGTGEGWKFGRYPQPSDFYAIIQSIAGVDHVDSLEVEIAATEANSSLSADTLIYSGNHVVNLS